MKSRSINFRFSYFSPTTSLYALAFFILAVFIFSLTLKWENTILNQEFQNRLFFEPNQFNLSIRTRQLNLIQNFQFDIQNTVVYIDQWITHWCTYYNDRSFYFNPRIDEIVQLFRSRGFSVIAISTQSKKIRPVPIQRKLTKLALRNVNPIPFFIYNCKGERARNWMKYYPDFTDSCVYNDDKLKGKYHNESFSPEISCLFQIDLFHLLQKLLKRLLV